MLQQKKWVLDRNVVWGRDLSGTDCLQKKECKQHVFIVLVLLSLTCLLKHCNLPIMLVLDHLPRGSQHLKITFIHIIHGLLGSTMCNNVAFPVFKQYFDRNKLEFLVKSCTCHLHHLKSRVALQCGRSIKEKQCWG